MELNLWALFAIAVGIVPGMPGETLYRLIASSNWREESWSRVFRSVGFSLAGLVLASVVCRVCDLGIFSTLTTSVSSKVVSEDTVFAVALLLVGQTVGSTLAGIGSGLVIRLALRWSPITPYSDGWKRFVCEFVPRHWVVVRLLDGGAYAGILVHADTTVPPEDRDLILSEPASYDDEKRDYCSLAYQHLFLPATSIASVGIVHDPEGDRRTSPVGGWLFEKETRDE